MPVYWLWDGQEIQYLHRMLFARDPHSTVMWVNYHHSIDPPSIQLTLPTPPPTQSVTCAYKCMKSNFFVLLLQSVAKLHRVILKFIKYCSAEATTSNSIVKLCAGKRALHLCPISNNEAPSFHAIFMKFCQTLSGSILSLFVVVTFIVAASSPLPLSPLSSSSKNEKMRNDGNWLF